MIGADLAAPPLNPLAHFILKATIAHFSASSANAALQVSTNDRSSPTTASRSGTNGGISSRTWRSRAPGGWCGSAALAARSRPPGRQSACDCNGGTAPPAEDSRRGSRRRCAAKADLARQGTTEPTTVRNLGGEPRSVGGGMGGPSLSYQALMLALRLAQLVSIVSPVATAQRDVEDSACAHAA